MAGRSPPSPLIPQIVKFKWSAIRTRQGIPYMCDPTGPKFLEEATLDPPVACKRVRVDLAGPSIVTVSPKKGGPKAWFHPGRRRSGAIAATVGCLAAAGPQARAGRRGATVCSGRRAGAGGEGQRAQSLSLLQWRILLRPRPPLLWRVAAVVWPPPRRSPVGGTAGVWSPLLRGICPLCWDVNPIPHHLSTFFRSEQPQVCLLSKHMDCKIKISICICPLKAVWRSRSSRPTHFVRV